VRWVDVKAYGALIVALVAGVVFCPSKPQTQSYAFAASSRWGEITQYGKAKTPVITAMFHGQADLDLIFKEGIEKSLIDLDRTSCGLVKLTIVWDFIPDQAGLLRATIRGDNVVMAVRSSTMKAAFNNEDENLLGLTQPGIHWVFLVIDRIDEPEMVVWVAAHEFGHTIGLEHVELGLMQTYAPTFPTTPITWERDDLREFCRVWSCKIEMFNDCRER